MSNVQAIILGLVQGLTEFLPVSSSGHLILVPKLFGWGDQGLGFDAMIHFGTALATIYYFRKDCYGLLLTLLGRNPDADMKSLRNAVLIGTLPALVIAFFAKDFIDAHARNVTLVAANLIIWSVILIIVDQIAARRDNSTIQPTRLRHAIIGGFAQAFALLPGTSRSGATISGAIAAGMNRPSAVRFSFLLGLPIILAASLVSSVELFAEVGSGEIALMPLLLGLLFSFLGGLAAIRILLKLISYRGLSIFAAYRIALAIVILVWLR